MTSQKFHELVVQALFSIDMKGDDPLTLLMRTLEISKKRAREGIAVAEAILEKQAAFDQVISQTSHNYDLSRIPLVEKNILRYALFQISEGEAASSVTQEAVRLARKFSTPEAGTFINAILNELFPRDEQETI